MQERYTKQAENVLALAKEAASSCGHSYIGTEHLLVGLVEEKEGTAGRVLEEFGIQADKAMALIDKLIAPPGNTAVSQKPGFSPRTRRVLEGAYAEAESMRFEEVGTEHILLAMLKETDCVGTRLLYTMGANIQKLYAAVLTAMGMDSDAIAEEFQAVKASKGRNSSVTPTLDQYSRDLTAMAEEGKLDPVVGRDKEIARLIQILSRRTKNNPCLTGEPGARRKSSMSVHNCSIIITEVCNACIIQSSQSIRVALLSVIMAVIVCSVYGFNGTAGEYLSIFGRCFKCKGFIFSGIGISESSFKIGNCQVICLKDAFYILKEIIFAVVIVACVQTCVIIKGLIGTQRAVPDYAERQ